MSLINRMLQDLDKRQQQVGEVDAVVAQPVPVLNRSGVRWLWWLGAAIIVLLLAWILLLQLPPESEFPLQPPSTPMLSAPMPVEGVEFQPENMPQPELDMVDHNSDPAILQEIQTQPNGELVELVGDAQVEEQPPILVGDNLALSKDTTEEPQTTAPEKPAAVEPEQVSPVEREVVVKSAKPSRPAVTVPKKSRGEVKQTSSESAGRTLRRAEELLTTGRISEAEAKLRRVLEMDPKRDRARELLVGLLIQSGRNNGAAQLLAEGRKIAPNHTLFALLQVRLLLQQGRRTAAIDLLKNMRESVDSGRQGLVMLAALQQQEGQHTEAVDSYKRLVKLQPGVANHWVGMGISLEALGLESEAIAAYDYSMRGGSLSPELGSYAAGRLKVLR